MAKKNWNKILLEKGERYLLFAGIGLGALFAALGVMALAGASDASVLAKQIENSSARINSAIANTNATVEDLPKWIDEPVTFNPLKEGVARNYFFIPMNPPDTRRRNPKVLTATEVQADAKLEKIKVYDIRYTPDGKKEIGVITVKTMAGAEAPKAVAGPKFFEGLNTRQQLRRPAIPPMGVEGAPVPKTPAEASEPPGQRSVSSSITYLPFPIDAEKLGTKVPAITIEPIRMNIIQAGFPYREQLDEIRKAMRLERLGDLPVDVPLFRNFEGKYTVEVQRRELLPNGQMSAWADLPIVENISTLFSRKLGDVEENPLYQQVMIHEDHGFVMPLPEAIRAQYPDIRMPGVKAAAEKRRAANVVPTAPTAPPSRLNGGGNPFKREAAAADALANQPGIVREGIAPSAPNLPRVEGVPAVAGAVNLEAEKCADMVLIRIIDNAITAGKQYEYRLRVNMQNPNWVGVGAKADDPKYNLVTQRQDANVEIITGDWSKPTEPVSMQSAEYLYAADAPSKEDAKLMGNVDLKPGQALLQYHKWLSYASTESYKEPVGDWVIANVVVTRAKAIGGQQLVNLPLWSSEKGTFVLRKGDVDPKTKEAKMGIMMDPTKPGPEMTAVEVDGGKIESRAHNKLITDDSAPEVLIRSEDGTLMVRSPVTDRAAPGRVERLKAWLKWVKDTGDAATEATNPDKKKDGPANPFDK